MDFILLTHQASAEPTKAGQTLVYAKTDGGVYALKPDGTELSLGAAVINLAQLLPAGGVAGQVLSKVDGTDYNVTWVNQTGGVGGGSVAWGSITGTLSSQTDLNSALSGKAASTHSHGFGDLSGVAAAGHDQSVTLAAGTYTPTLTNVANAGSLSPSVAQYIRVGGTTTVSGKLTFTPSAGGGTTTRIGISLPVASNLTADSDLAGSATGNSATQLSTSNGIVTFAALGDAANDRAELNGLCYFTGANALWYHFTYAVK